jgi:hypothetical protein
MYKTILVNSDIENGRRVVRSERRDRALHVRVHLGKIDADSIGLDPACWRS